MSASHTAGASAPQQGDDWLLEGADGQAIRGSTDAPSADQAPRAIVLFAHGFKGYKDYGFIPILAAHIANALPALVHRFNFSHSGIGADPTTFERPDLFERDTWSKQAFDLGVVDAAARAGALPGASASNAGSLPVVWMGHSRGGASCVLAAGRRFRDGSGPAPDAIITMSAPAAADRLSEADKQRLRAGEPIESPSSRTGQVLRVGPDFLREIERAPEDHDITSLAQRIACQALVAHGSEDPTVPVDDAQALAAALPRAELAVIEGADHVFNTPNPADPQAPRSAQLTALAERIVAFVRERV